jgi:hypothetical protein
MTGGTLWRFLLLAGSLALTGALPTTGRSTGGGDAQLTGR